MTVCMANAYVTCMVASAGITTVNHPMNYTKEQLSDETL